MSQTIRNQTGNQITIDTNVAKIFVFSNRFENANFNNDGYVDVTILRGTLMGRVTATGKIIALVSTAVDGSEIPVGILNEDHTIAFGANKDVSICVAGDVVEDLVVLSGADTMETIIDGRSIRDRIAADTVGIKLVGGDELSKTDN